MCSDFFKAKNLLVTIRASSEQKLFQNSYFFLAVIFQNSYFFRAKLWLSTYLLKISSSLYSYFFKTATFLEDELIQSKVIVISIEELLCTSKQQQHQIFQKSYFFNKASSTKRGTFTEKLVFQSNYFSETANFPEE